jgi:hypothetical protein
MTTGATDRINTPPHKASGPNFHSPCGINPPYPRFNNPYIHNIP